MSSSESSTLNATDLRAKACGPLVSDGTTADAHLTPERVPRRVEFLQELFGTDAPGYLPLWRRCDKRSHWIAARQLEDAARLTTDQDLYFGVALHDRCEALRLSKNDNLAFVRGSNGSAIALGGLAADFDVQGPTHKSEKLPQTFEEAWDFIDRFPLPPTAVVHSGYGLQPWWFFKELQVFGGEEGRQKAQVLTRRFDATIRKLAAPSDWSFDNTSDLARVLRLPETFNAKLQDPVEVRIVLWRPRHRYDLSTMEQYLVAAQKTQSQMPRVEYSGSPDRLTERARRWLAKRAPAIQGSGGDAWTYITAACLLNDFALPEDVAWRLLLEWNQGCDPPWHEHGLRVKFDSAKRSPHRGQTFGRLRDAEIPVHRRAPSRTRSASLPKHPPGRGERFVVEVGWP